jgi:hypothetical protein
MSLQIYFLYKCNSCKSFFDLKTRKQLSSCVVDNCSGTGEYVGCEQRYGK